MTENELLDELTKELACEEMQPDDVTPDMLSKSTGLGRRRCAVILADKYEKGELKRRKVRINGAPGFAYYK